MIIALQSLVYYYFREALLRILDRLIQPYFKGLALNQDAEDDEAEVQVFAEYDDEKGVVFYPPVYAQRYAAVSDCLMDDRWIGNLEKVVDLGFHDMSFIKYLKEVPGVRKIIGVDIECFPLRCSFDLIGSGNFSRTREIVEIKLFQGNAADPDYRLIGADAVVAIEMIEHMLPHDLEKLVHTIFGFIRPRIAIFTTPNGDFNVLFNALERNGLRRMDHFFEWSREQFHDWCSNIVVRYPDYTVICKGIGPGPEGTDHLGCCSQLALFVSKNYHKQQDLNPDSLSIVSRLPNADKLEDILDSCDSRETLMDTNKLNCTTMKVKKFSKSTQKLMAKNKIDSLVHTRDVVTQIKQLAEMLNLKERWRHCEEDHIWNNINWGENAPYWNQYYLLVKEYQYPFEEKPQDSLILEQISLEIIRLSDEHVDDDPANGDFKLEIPLEYLMRAVEHLTNDVEKVRELLDWNGYDIVDDVVVYSRQMVDDASDCSSEGWRRKDHDLDVNTCHFKL